GAEHVNAPVERVLEVSDHLRDGLEALGRILLQAPLDEVAVLRGRRPLRGMCRTAHRLGRRLFLDRVEELGEVRWLAEVMAEVDPLREEDRRAVDVASFVDRLDVAA